MQDEALQVTDDLVLVGREDYSAAPARARSAQLLTGVDQSDFILMLDHQPRQLEENREAGVICSFRGIRMTARSGRWVFLAAGLI